MKNFFKKNIKNFIFCILFLLSFGINVVFAETTCTYTYAYSEFYAGSEETNDAAKGATIKLEMPSKKAEVTKRADNKILWIFDNSYSFGGSDTIDWNKGTCPLYIVAYAEDADWYGYDGKPDLTKFAENKETKQLKSMGMHIFMNDKPSESIYTCNYDGFSITFDSEGKAIHADDKLSNTGIKFSYKLDSSLTDYPAEVPGICENVYTCVTTYVPSTGTSSAIQYYNVYSGSIDLASKQDSECLDSIMTLFTYQTAEEISKESGDNSACRTYTNRWKILEETYNVCSINASSCSIYSSYKNNIKNWCNSVMKFVDYGDACLDRCLNLKKSINELEKTTSNTKQCGLSGKLILWIANIVKWIKYIVPVIAIVMGILDFIKAIANGKDDEIKKAQGHFVKRLIAAALIFITPFIIEFILDKMGFDANGCGIIDL